MHKQIEKMTFKQLKDHKAKVDQLLSEKESNEKNKLRAQAEILIKKSGCGFTLSDVMGVPAANKRQYTKSGKARKKHSSKVLIRHPQDPTKVYRGLGRKPAWLKEIEAPSA